MKIGCDGCGARYTIDDDRVHARTFKFRCKRCGRVAVVRCEAAAAAPPARATTPTSECSGLVEIRALAAQAMASSSPAEVRQSPAPLLTSFAVVPASPALPLLPHAGRSARGPLWFLVGAAAATAITAGVVVALTLGRHTDEPRPPTVARLVAKAPAVPVVTSAIVEPHAPPRAPHAPPLAVALSTAVASDLPPATPRHRARVTPTRQGATPATPANQPDATSRKPLAPPPRSAPPATAAGDDLRALLEPTPERIDVSARPIRPVVATLPAQLGAADIKAAMNALRPRVDACFRQFHVAGTALAVAHLEPDGQPGSVHIAGALADTPTGDCVARAVKTATFPPFAGHPMSITYPFLLR